MEFCSKLKFYRNTKHLLRNIHIKKEFLCSDNGEIAKLSLISDDTNKKTLVIPIKKYFKG